jgi:hypothetical protein
VYEPEPSLASVRGLRSCDPTNENQQGIGIGIKAFLFVGERKCSLV